MQSPRYVLVTPARNEERTLGETIESVIRQTVTPAEWIIVSDNSTDKTDEIVKAYAARHPFIRLLRRDNRSTRNFASVVFAVEEGISALKVRDYDFIGLLDADVRFGARYFEEVLARFKADPRLGMAGGLVTDVCEGQRRRNLQSLREVAGAVQLFRRSCFESLGGLLAIPEGGWDTVTCVRARMNSYRTCTFPELEVDHLKPRNVAEGNLVRRFYQLGVREYALGNHPLFEMAKCAYRLFEYPYVLGGLMRFCGYSICCLRRRQRMLPAEVLAHIRHEQLSRLLRRKDSSPALAPADGIKPAAL